MKKGLLLYLFLVVSLTLQGNVYFKHIGKTDGLPQISVMSICQDELGRMWFGTLEGLGCYDGNSMTVYKPSSEPTRNFLGNEIHNLVSDKQGNIFFTSDNVLIHYDLHKEQFSPLQRKVNCLHAQGHTVWAATQDSVFKWNPAKKQFAFVYRLKPSQYITSLYSDTNDCLWLGTSRGLYRIDNLATPTPVCVIAEVNVHSLYRDTKGRMWVAAFRQGMYKIENGISQKFVIEKDFALSNNDVRCFVEDNEGSIWIGTFNGLNKIDTAGNVSYYKKDTQPGNLKHLGRHLLWRCTILQSPNGLLQTLFRRCRQDRLSQLLLCRQYGRRQTGRHLDMHRRRRLELSKQKNKVIHPLPGRRTFIRPVVL